MKAIEIQYFTDKMHEEMFVFQPVAIRYDRVNSNLPKKKVIGNKAPRIKSKIATQYSWK